MNKPKIRKPRAIKGVDNTSIIATVDNDDDRLIRLGLSYHWYMDLDYAKKIHKWLGQAILYLEQKEGRKR